MSGLSSKSSSIATLRWEIVIVLAVTFGMSGLRAALRLVQALASPTPLKGQTAQLNPSQAPVAWLDVSLQVLSAGTLVAWGALAVYMLWVHPVTTNPVRFLRWSGLSDLGRGSGRSGVVADPFGSVWCVGGAARGHLGAVERLVPRVPGAERGRGERDHGADFRNVFRTHRPCVAADHCSCGN